MYNSLYTNLIAFFCNYFFPVNVNQWMAFLQCSHFSRIIIHIPLQMYGLPHLFIYLFLFNSLFFHMFHVLSELTACPSTI